MRFLQRVTAALAVLTTAFAFAPSAFADSNPVSITCPAPITVEASAPASAFVTPGGAAASSTAGTVTITGPAAGFYPLGTTTVTYTATDTAGNSASCTTTITVVDTTPPSIVCEAPITAEATGNLSANVALAGPTASDIAGTPVIAGPIGTFSFPLGTTQVGYTATDPSGNVSSCSTLVTVVDTTPPTITCPANITVVAGSTGTAVVTYSIVASDVAGGQVTISSIPVSGSTFAIGTTTVTATATDLVGNQASCAFTVTVNPFVPTTVAQCKDGGWMAFGIFKNQGECVRFVTAGKT